MSAPLSTLLTHFSCINWPWLIKLPCSYCHKEFSPDHWCPFTSGWCKVWRWYSQWDLLNISPRQHFQANMWLSFKVWEFCLGGVLLLVKIILCKFKCLTTLLVLAICRLRNKVGYRKCYFSGRTRSFQPDSGCKACFTVIQSFPNCVFDSLCLYRLLICLCVLTIIENCGYFPPTFTHSTLFSILPWTHVCPPRFLTLRERLIPAPFCSQDCKKLSCNQPAVLLVKAISAEVVNDQPLEWGDLRGRVIPCLSRGPCS